MIRGIAICILFANLFRLAGCVAIAGAPELRSVLPVKPQISITVTSPYPAIIYVSPSLLLPYTAVNGSPTNKLAFEVTQREQFFRAALTNFPLTNQPVRVRWNSVATAASYRIYFGDAQTNWQQTVDTANKTQLTTPLWRCHPTNTAAMTSFDTNGLESAMSKVVLFKPNFTISIFRN